MDEMDEELDFGLQDSESEETEEVKHTPKKVEIEITDGHFFSDGAIHPKAPFTSVGYMASYYGARHPCETDEEIQQAIRNDKETILKEGDIPIVKDLRERNKLTRWLA